MSSFATSADPLRIAVVADTPGPASQIARTLRHFGHSVCTTSLVSTTAQDRLESARPDAIVLRVGPQTFELATAFVGTIAGNTPALVMLTPRGSPWAGEVARQTGALVHLIEPLPPQALLAAIQVAVARAGDLRSLRAQLARKREVVSSRPAIERAKAILMARFGFTEQEAHRRLQLESRNHNRRLSDTAWRVIRADHLLRAAERHRSSQELPG